MRIFVDTNVLVRIRQLGSADCLVAESALDRLRNENYRLCLTPQIIYEYWAVSTRPIGANGLGIAPSEVRGHLSQIKSLFEVLDEDAATFRIWQQLVNSIEVRGKVVHDTRIIASMLLYGLNGILTFNVADFKRFTEIQVITPADVVKTPHGQLPPLS